MCPCVLYLELFLNQMDGWIDMRCKLTIRNLTIAKNYNGKCDNENKPSNDHGQITPTECNLFHHVLQLISPYGLIRINILRSNQNQHNRCDKIVSYQLCWTVCHFKCSLVCGYKMNHKLEFLIMLPQDWGWIKCSDMKAEGEMFEILDWLDNILPC